LSPNKVEIFLEIKIKILGSECQTSGTYAKRAKQAAKKDLAAACLYFLNYQAFLRRQPTGLFPYFPWLYAEVAHTGFSGLIRLFKEM
jgi:hypothetical protein